MVLSSLCLLFFTACSTAHSDSSQIIEYYDVFHIDVEQFCDDWDCFNSDHAKYVHSLGLSVKDSELYVSYEMLSNQLVSMNVPNYLFPFSIDDFNDSFAFLFFRYGSITDDYRYWDFHVEGLNFCISEAFFEKSDNNQHLIDIVFIPFQLAHKYGIPTEQYAIRLEYYWRY